MLGHVHCETARTSMCTGAEHMTHVADTFHSAHAQAQNIQRLVHPAGIGRAERISNVAMIVARVPPRENRAHMHQMCYHLQQRLGPRT